MRNKPNVSKNELIRANASAMALIREIALRLGLPKNGTFGDIVNAIEKLKKETAK